ncbi:zincin [Fistulina hepatica ATCC 64428]|uniref:Zincin n=1 Tax=Fistulina hepatica ATCC 64428 TaxID=1128425 RepID=A0A0D7A7I7_9AGAR|nr:zincin [Fistulina hepatica ATCC 64428]
MTRLAFWRSCGFSVSDEKIAAAERHFSQNRVVVDTEAVRRTSSTVVINVHVHVIAANETEEGGYLLDSAIEEQMSVLNDDFEDTGLSFSLGNTQRIVNQTWFSEVGPDEDLQTEMKSQLRSGSVSDLNVYSVGFETGSGAGLLGYSTFPSDYEDDPADDGVVILFSTLPGGNTQNYNQGRTLTHEVGHWVGLYHTFQGGCDGAGDGVDDTPPEANATYGCPRRRNSCPGGGSDPIHNFMDYSYDECLESFTAGKFMFTMTWQISRLQDQMATYRDVMFES